MKQFMDVARWDWCLHRALYIKGLLIALAAISIPSLLFVVGVLLISPVMIHEDIYVIVSSLTEAVISFSLFVLTCNVFFILKERRQRPNELMLPASNLSKFVWRVVLVLLGFWLLSFLWSFALDGLRYAVVAMKVGAEHARFLAWDMGKGISLFVQSRAPGEASLGLRFYLWTVNILFAWIASGIFVWLSAWSPRRALLYALLLSGVFYGLLVISTVGLTFILKHVVAFMIVLLVVLLALLPWVWWMAYRQYCRAQIISKENP